MVCSILKFGTGHNFGKRPWTTETAFLNINLPPLNQNLDEAC